MWNLVNGWSRRTLEKASERVADVQGDDDDFEEIPIPPSQTVKTDAPAYEPTPMPPSQAAETDAAASETKKSQ